jgi:hypothetical protein
LPPRLSLSFFELFFAQLIVPAIVSVGPHGDVMLRADENDTASGLLPADSAPLPGHIAMYQTWVQEMSVVTDFMASFLQPTHRITTLLMRFAACTAVMWDALSCSRVDEDGGSMFPQIVDSHLPDYTASHSRRPQ